MIFRVAADVVFILLFFLPAGSGLFQFCVQFLAYALLCILTPLDAGGDICVDDETALVTRGLHIVRGDLYSGPALGAILVGNDGRALVDRAGAFFKHQCFPPFIIEWFLSGVYLVWQLGADVHHSTHGFILARISLRPQPVHGTAVSSEKICTWQPQFGQR
jgi:hypothetical protein